MSSVRQSPITGSWLTVLALLLSAASTVLVLGVMGSPLAVPVGAWASGLTGVASGAVVLVRARPYQRSEVFRVLIGLAAIVWGAGQVMVGGLVLQGATYPTAGDIVSLLSGPIAIMGLAAAPRRATEPLAGLRLACDSITIGGIAAVLVWRLAFAEFVSPGTSAGATSIAILLVELSVVAMLFIASVRELDRGMLSASVGVALFLGGDVYSQFLLVQPGGDWPWQAMVLACLAWPLVCWGLLRISAEPPDLPDRERPRAEHRRTIVTSLTLTALMLAVLGTVVARAAIDSVTVALLTISCAAVALRDVVVARQSRALLSRVSQLAYVDHLSGLGNRRALVERLDEQDGSTASWLLTLDLDNFKMVNGLLGHTGGDALLRAVSDRLASAVDPPNEVFRLGGDEFAVLSVGRRQDAEELADQLLLAVRLAALSVPGVGRVGVSASIGIAPVRSSTNPLLALAESATSLQVAKNTGRDRYVTFAGDVAATSRRRNHVERRLKVAVEQRSITLNAQPVVRLDTGDVTGVEFLARWTDPELGRVGPMEFFEVAESSALVVPLGEHLLDLAVETAVQHRFGERDIVLGVNVSPVQLRVPGFADRVLARLAATDIKPRRLVVEITEQIFVSDSDPAVTELLRLAAGGVTLAVDDFGAGSASLGYLRRIPARILKLDRGLVSSLHHDSRSAAIVSSMARLSADLGLLVVAEGIEDEATAQTCRDLGIPLGQGWHFSRDVPLVDLESVGLPLLSRPPVSGAVARRS